MGAASHPETEDPSALQEDELAAPSRVEERITASGSPLRRGGKS